VRERIEYRFRVPSATVFTLYSYSKALEYRFRVPTAGSLRACLNTGLKLRGVMTDVIRECLDSNNKINYISPQ
jgi:hypothetical protein